MSTNTTNKASELKRKFKIEHRHFYDIVDYLRPGDVLVLNNSKVFPARLIGRKETGGKIEVFLLRENPPGPLYQGGQNPLNPPFEGGQYQGGDVWQCLLGGRGRKEGLKIEFKKGLKCKVIKDNDDGTWEVKFNKGGKELMKMVGKIGLTPLPPYIKRSLDSIASLQNDKENYQTVYADNKKVGSVAAPTAGFHFTSALIKKLKKKGVQLEYVTLHVGLGTFAPVKVDDITKHKMHAEWMEADKKTIARIYLAKGEGRRVIAVGTTSVRTLESIFSKIPNYPPEADQPLADKLQIANKIQNPKSKIQNFSGWTDIFIYPGYKFKVVDALITNFHLPKSTLLMLVSAFAGKKNIDKAYQEAIKKKYRFYSYGDAMFIPHLSEYPAVLPRDNNKF